MKFALHTSASVPNQLRFYHQMKRVSEKVKDIVDVCPFAQVYDLAADAKLTLDAYRFTEITAALMAKWLDSVAEVRPGQGSAMSLAGLRGVGKSHFLAVVAALVSHPELRASITDPHVAASAERLPRRPGKAIFVRRGSGDSLVAELKQSISETLGRDPGELTDSINELLLTAFERGGEAPLILFDTAAGRDERVARDDGPVLSHIAETARTMGLFVGVALDDDISGADGPNSSIVTNFSIDYLDQEHLYKIVDNHIFTKRTQRLPLLHDIYEEYRATIPGFRWSEQRFTSLYPLHPETLEIAPLIRLYIQDFSLLGFAAETGAKILGRPANSLIGLDELFDNVEQKLRGSDELVDVFAAYDDLEREVIGKGPVKQRLMAKLALKGLFVLSLNGQGATAADIAAAMMIMPAETDDGGVEAILRSLADAMPDAIETRVVEGSSSRYGFRIGEKDDLRTALVEAAKEVDDAAVWSVLLRQTAEKFSDLEINERFGEEPTACSLEWRGSIRRGEIVWDRPAGAPPAHDPIDWRLIVQQHGDEEDHPADDDPRTFVWQTATPTAEEADVLRRSHVLHSNTDLRERGSAAWSNAVHVHSVAVEKIWERLFIEDARIISATGEAMFSGEAVTAYSISHMLSVLLAPAFEAVYPQHPHFPVTFGPKQTALLIGGFFGGVDAGGPDAQRAALEFALPLGLAVSSDAGTVPASAEELVSLDMLQSLLAVAAEKGTAVLPLNEVATRLQAPPYGLTRESQQLVLAALVSQRQFDFVTGGGDRINHRSLDLQIIWDDIVGIALPAGQSYSSERLLVWARLVTGNSSLASIERPADRELINDSLTRWLDGWRELDVVAGVDAIGDQSLNTRVWRLATSVRRSLGAMADIIADPARDHRKIDACLQKIAELFSDSEDEFEQRRSELRDLAALVAAEPFAAMRREYLALADVTDDASIEGLRSQLIEAELAGEAGIDSESWDAFQSEYTDYYRRLHEEANGHCGSSDAANALSSPAIEVFESVADLPWFPRESEDTVRRAIRALRRPACRADVEEALRSYPACACGFRLDDLRGGSYLDQLNSALTSGLTAFARRLADARPDLTATIPSDDAAALASLIDRIATETLKNGFAELDIADVRLLRAAADAFGQPSAPDGFVMHDADAGPAQGQMLS